MAVRPIVMHPDTRLRRVCAPVVAGPAVSALADDLLDTMYAAQGRGLAAPQVGVGWRLFVFDATWKTGEPTPEICLNPEVEPVGSDRAFGPEQCLSIPDHPVEVDRATRVRMRWQRLDGASQEQVFEGAAAVIVQHEADHLDGRLIVDFEADT